ncbi:alpha/beta hydrolase family protein [Tuwongella immobilis]|uniref:Peptidase S9 prolyl oligopeptidase catalytic domain-containing protein n=1 Tax=Tuwongella immobilis TaxID=692036 RepID=A0A6C2YXI5_9BACT|nr:prolyl oligopeptidase family serine peptidase [Tuwongella immobilis]VIP05522.1 Uncharacterized protein OS=Pirellula staleyi (strain ATCC 27377 / DSM 6068 / ICPB 4128) GN=Psta_1487 PE=4 SV=1: Abhydrolase_5 [Tuwongella immobilis]VTS08400.1 Uncharacterized protein OS=Pirellula staleyi (strain ATCC 27377 / DSM 6068 / ICPB 4128) GN=Psta_1487 PE=4 SV=1: Abhydrolase_5 [Tuwongella immobilis]
MHRIRACLIGIVALSALIGCGKRPNRKPIRPVEISRTAAPILDKILQETQSKFAPDWPAVQIRVLPDGELQADIVAVNSQSWASEYLSGGVPIVVSEEDLTKIQNGKILTITNSSNPPRFGFVNFPAQPQGKLVDARKNFSTRLTKKSHPQGSAGYPPRETFNLVLYPTSLGFFEAFLSKLPKDDQKHPAIIWITGGDCNTIDQGCYNQGPYSADQSASAYREAGIVMMFPSLRGGNSNPGQKEGFLGEVDDVIAAADFLAKQPGIDPNRIYLGGHSTGGTLVLLAAASSSKFRAVFSFGPADTPVGYPEEFTPFDTNDPFEVELRAPIKWLQDITTPTFLFEGAKEPSNADAVHAMSNRVPLVQGFVVQGRDHFTVLAVNNLIAERILADTGPTCNLKFSEPDFAQFR